MEHSPYQMSKEEEVLFEELMAQDGEERRGQLEVTARRLKDADEYEAIKLY
jgi:hypothetical protein